MHRTLAAARSLSAAGNAQRILLGASCPRSQSTDRRDFLSTMAKPLAQHKAKVIVIKQLLKKLPRLRYHGPA
jgi:hypothetical protein